jgi:hypothetical protein
MGAIVLRKESLGALWAAVFLASGALLAEAQDQQVGARTKAMGGSYTAFEDDPVSIWLNPGGIASQTDGGVLVYQTYTLYDLKTNSSGGANTAPSQLGWSDPAVLPSYLGVVFQLGTADSPQSLGFCFATPFRLRLQYLPYDFTTGTSGTSPRLSVDQSFARIRSAYARDFQFKPAGFFTHLAVGLGVDINVTDWNFTEFKSINGGTDTATLSVSDRNVGFGGGAGFLLGVFDNRKDVKVNLGGAYQSRANYSFSINAIDVPLFDWPDQFQGGVTVYLLEGLPLRLTADAQVIQWSSAVRHSLLPGVGSFRDVTNFSIGRRVRDPGVGAREALPARGRAALQRAVEERERLAGRRPSAPGHQDEVRLVHHRVAGAGRRLVERRGQEPDVRPGLRRRRRRAGPRARVYDGVLGNNPGTRSPEPGKIGRPAPGDPSPFDLVPGQQRADGDEVVREDQVRREPQQVEDLPKRRGRPRDHEHAAVPARSVGRDDQASVSGGAHVGHVAEIDGDARHAAVEDLREGALEELDVAGVHLAVDAQDPGPGAHRERLELQRAAPGLGQDGNPPGRHTESSHRPVAGSLTIAEGPTAPALALLGLERREDVARGQEDLLPAAPARGRLHAVPAHVARVGRRALLAEAAHLHAARLLPARRGVQCKSVQG